MIKIGITGGIGTGKSTVCRIFELLNVSIYYSDDRAKELMNTNSNIRKAIIEQFGNDSYKEQVLDRNYLAKKVFQNKENIHKINQIVHPVVAQDFEKWCNEQKGAYILKETALMFETNAHLQMNQIICVTAPLELRIARTLNRDAYRTKSDVLKIIEKQLSEEEKIRRSDYVISNDNSQLLIPQVLAIHKQILAHL